MPQFDEMLSTAERNLNDSLRHFEQQPRGPAQELEINWRLIGD